MSVRNGNKSAFKKTVVELPVSQKGNLEVRSLLGYVPAQVEDMAFLQIYI